MTTEVQKIPSLAELVEVTELTERENGLMVLLNQAPPVQWLKYHPTVKVKDERGNDVPAPYLPIERVEYILSRVFTKWWVEILSTQCIANSIVVTVRVFVKNPVTGETDHQDGVGASPIQTNKGAGAMDWNQAKSSGVQMAAPSAETYAIKDAAEKFGKLFGKDLCRKEVVDYTNLYKPSNDLPKEVYLEIEAATTKDHIIIIYDRYPQYHSNTDFTDALKTKKANL